MKTSILALASLLTFALANPIPQAEDDQCFCDFQCATSIPIDCECELSSKNTCYTTQLAQNLTCSPPTLSTECSSRLPVGSKGDACLGFTAEPQPPCGPGLTCILTNSEVSDLGGTCQEITAPGPGEEGATCGATRGQVELLADCNEGLSCVVREGCADCLGTCQAEVVKGGLVEGDQCTFGPGVAEACGEGLVCALGEGQSACFNPDGPCPGVCQIEFHILPVPEGQK